MNDIEQRILDALRASGCFGSEVCAPGLPCACAEDIVKGVRAEIDGLRADLQAQWEANHWEHWYVLATWQVGAVINMRIVAGPLPLNQAQDEAQERVRKRTTADVSFAVVEFDPAFMP